MPAAAVQKAYVELRGLSGGEHLWAAVVAAEKRSWTLGRGEGSS